MKKTNITNKERVEFLRISSKLYDDEIVESIISIFKSEHEDGDYGSLVQYDGVAALVFDLKEIRGLARRKNDTKVDFDAFLEFICSSYLKFLDDEGSFMTTRVKMNKRYMLLMVGERDVDLITQFIGKICS